MDLVQFGAIQSAADSLSGVVSRTPLERSRVLSGEAGGHIYLKCENLQRTGSFKIRGAYNCINRLSDDQRARGVVAASAGNHAQGVALAATLLGVRSTVFMPEGASLPKVEATAKYGAKVVLEGMVFDEALSAAREYSESSGGEMVPPFDHLDVIAGQGTIAVEVLEQLPEAASIVVPVGGGGLISGIAAAAKALKPDIRIIGVEPEGAAKMSKALSAGSLVDLPNISTIADGLATKKASELTLAHVSELVDEVVTVSEDEIGRALLLITERAKLVVEPAGAVGIAALVVGKGDIDFPGVVVLSGGNIDPLLLLRVIRFGMGAAGRYFWFRTRVSDRPGELHRLLGVLADAGANVMGIDHHREGSRLKHLGEVEVIVEVETRGADHIEQLRSELAGSGYSVDPL